MFIMGLLLMDGKYRHITRKWNYDSVTKRRKQKFNFVRLQAITESNCFSQQKFRQHKQSV